MVMRLVRRPSAALPRPAVTGSLKRSQLFAARTVSTTSSGIRIPPLHSYGLMSHCAYLHNTPNISDAAKATLKANQWEIKEFPQGLKTSGYVGCIFINHSARQIVVAHAGTLPNRYKTLIADLQGVVRGRSYPLVIDALLQVHDADMANLLKNGYHLSFTGHSLGAFLAEMSLFACHRGLVIKHPQVSAVTFDSPGSLEIMKLWQSNVQKEEVDLNRLNVTTFLSSPNLVNTLHHHPGTVYRLIRDLGNLNGAFNSVSYLLESHNLSKMVELFDPITGLPKEGSYCRMADWPVADYSGVFGLARSPVSGTMDLLVTKSLDILGSVMEKVTGTAKDGPVITISGGRGINILGRELGTGKEKTYHTVYDTTTADGLTKLLDTHYQVASSTHPINRCMARVNFPPHVYEFLSVFNKCKDEPTYKEFLKQSGINQSELPEYSIEDGMIVTKDPVDVFELRNQAYGLLSKYGELIETHEVMYEKYFKNQVDKLQKEVKDLRKKNLTIEQLEERLSQLKTKWSQVEGGGKTFMSACIVSEAEGTKVAKVLGKDDYAPDRQKEREEMAKTMNAMDIFMQGCVVVKTPGAQGLMLPNEEIHPSVKEAISDFFGASNNTTQSGGQNTTVKKKPE